MRTLRAAPRSQYEIVALATSAGGLAALRAVLSVLPADFAAAVLVMQHLGRYGSALVDILAAHTRLPVRWVTEGTHLVPGGVWVCPPQRMVDVGPDNRCTLRAGVHRATARPIDALFGSLAEHGGTRVIAVVLTGLGYDGAEGVRALGRDGATVLAQSEASAEYAAMPRAALATGAVDLILPLDEIGPTLVRVVAGEVLPRSSAERDARAALFRGHGAVVVGPLLADADWEVTPLGPVMAWPPALCAALRIALASHIPVLVHWGLDLVTFYNDAALALGQRVGHAGALGASAGASPTGLPTIGRLRDVLRTGASEFGTDQHLGDGGPTHGRDVAVAVSCSAILDPAAARGIGGVLTLATESVLRVIARPISVISRS